MKFASEELRAPLKRQMHFLRPPHEEPMAGFGFSITFLLVLQSFPTVLYRSLRVYSFLFECSQLVGVGPEHSVSCIVDTIEILLKE